MSKKASADSGKGSIKLFLGKDPWDSTIEWKEWELQAYIIQEARRSGYMVSGSMEQGLRSSGAGARAKACGLTKGEPDMRFYLPMGRVLFVELKTMAGKVSKEQKEYHERLGQLGHWVEVIKMPSPGLAWGAICERLHEDIGNAGF